MENSEKGLLNVLPVADTVSGTAAREVPEKVLGHYTFLSTQLWMSPKVRVVADSVFSTVQQGRTSWGSLSGPYGFGKTASAITLWAHAKDSGFLAIPPISCTSFNELAYGIAALAGIQAPKIKKQIDKLFRDVFMEGLNPMVQTDAKRYSVPLLKVRQIYRDKFAAGQFTLDSHPHRAVEFLVKLGQLAAESSKGLVIILDELQQLLGPLDARAIVRFREFVWGMRTERSPCGVIIALDSLLEARLARWAADILHRIRENGPALQLANIYNREFPSWLWSKLTNSNGKGALAFPLEALTKNVLLSLGQLVERPDLANGPRTVVDVFSRAVVHYQKTGASYDITNLIVDIHQGRFRYFGEGGTIQSILTQVLSDEWILHDEGRKTMVTTLAAFPLGCSQQMLQQYIPDEKQLERARSELFGPLLIELSEGLALEPLQQVRRVHNNWEQTLSRCWETLPALDALAGYVPDMVYRILVPKLFPNGTPASPVWERISDESTPVLTGWHRLRGTFDDAYPQREVALCVTGKKPESWPQDVDVCIALVCDTSTDSGITPKVEFPDKNRAHSILIQLPILRPLEDRIPSDMQRYQKYIQPEPFRPATILAALHELEAFLGDLIENSDATDTHSSPGEQTEIKRVAAFVDIAVDFLLRELLVGQVEVGIGPPISLRGPELLHALFTQVCRNCFPQYQTLIGTANWQDILFHYKKGVSSDWLSSAQRQGREEIVMPKAKMYEALFGQMSTAAGDSFIKKLGPLVEATGNPKSFSLCLAMHPAEDALIGYLKGLSPHQSIPVSAAVEFLRHQGYIHTETEEIVKILVARECLTTSSEEEIRVIRTPELERDRLLKKIIEMNRELCRLEVEDNPDSPPQGASIANLQEHLDLLEVRLKERIEEQIKELENGIASLHDLIGTVRASTVPIDWSDSKLSTHLTGVATRLQKTQEPLLKSLRKEAKRIKRELDSSAGSEDVEWATVMQGKRQSFSNAFQRLQERVIQFETRVKALTSWKLLNSQLRSTDELCTLVGDTESGPPQALKQLVDEFRERFATDSWSPLFTSSEFSERLGIVQSDVQRLLYSYVQTFNRELEEIRSRFNTLLPSAAPPVFDISIKDRHQNNPIQGSFQKLYKWAYESFYGVVAECRRRRQSGVQWCALNNGHRGWKTLESQLEARLQKTKDTLDFETIQYIGETVLLMQSGFISTDDNEEIIGLHDDPHDPPDFKKLEKLFEKGEIQIHVQVKRKSSS